MRSIGKSNHVNRTRVNRTENVISKVIINSTSFGFDKPVDEVHHFARSNQYTTTRNILNNRHRDHQYKYYTKYIIIYAITIEYCVQLYHY